MEKPLVLDIGTFSTKIGLAGDPKPAEERTIIVNQEIEQKENTESTFYYGNNGVDLIQKTAKHKSRGGRVNTSVEHNISIDNDNNILQYLENVIFANESLPNITKGSNHRMLLTDHLMQRKTHRSSLAELCFEKFETPAIYFEFGGVLGLYSTGRLNGLVCDMGHSQTSLTPIVQGYCIENAARKANIGGQHFGEYFNYLLRKSGITLHTPYQLEIVRDIKESTAQCRTDCAYEKLQEEEEMNCEKYEMPDGTVLQIGNARQRAPEMLFGPQLLGLQCKGIHHQILDCINDCDLGLRKELMSHITLIGGTSLLKGFGQRLINELVSTDYNRYNYQLLVDQSSSGKSEDRGPASPSAAAPVATITKPTKMYKKTCVRVYAPKTRKYCAWIGGSVLCSMDGFEDLAISKSQYNESGNSVLYRE